MTNIIPGPAYRIETKHLVIRCWKPADAPLLKDAIDASMSHLLPFMPWAAAEPQPLQVKIDLLRRFRSEFDSGRNYVHGIFNKDETRVVGGTGLHPRVGELAHEIGYWIHVDFVRQGFATEVSAALTRVAFEVDHVERVEIHCDPANTYSAAVPRKLGYTFDGKLRSRLRQADGSWRDTLVFSMLAEEFTASSAQTIAADIRALDAAGRPIIG
ncbi:MAG TPA: GNAT family protein [Anaerolineae bacterium]|jgi:RimJ/RimL family protein N-acetyltransferase